jgi:energy-coupling factor transporter ATP-binding protein EcfA2
MEQAVVRSVTHQLAEDLAWLEEHARKQSGKTARAAELRYAAALVRNVVAPLLEGQPSVPLHVAVVGGAGAGKSTVANMLCGAILAESNPQAGYTRHPVAYVPTANIAWPSGLGFLGPLQRLSKPEPSSLDADVYQIRRVSQESGQFGVLDKFVVWDCPDMTTWAATGYVPRLLEVTALADVVVYVASDERYNDEVPTQFLKLLLESGKMVVVCLMKMRATDAPAFIAHFHREVIEKMPARPVAILTVPQLTRAQLTDPNRNAPEYRVPIVNQIFVLGEPINAARQRTARAATQYLQYHQLHLLSVARDDVEALDGWHNLVREAQTEFENRYQREYLTTERFRRFDDALVRLLELLELPGVGRFASKTLDVLRMPYTLTKKLFQTAFARPEGANMPERQVLEGALGGWIDLLRKEASRKASSHALWNHVHQGFSSGLIESIKERFNESFRTFEVSLGDEIERTARAIYEDLEKSPVALNTIRGTKFTAELAAVGAGLYIGIATGGVGGLLYGAVAGLVATPLATSLIQLLTDFFGKNYVDYHREQTRIRQLALVQQNVAAPLALWISRWPTTGGSEYEKLQQILRRFPDNIKQLEASVEMALRK